VCLAALASMGRGEGHLCVGGGGSPAAVGARPRGPACRRGGGEAEARGTSRAGGPGEEEARRLRSGPGSGAPPPGARRPRAAAAPASGAGRCAGGGDAAGAAAAAAGAARQCCCTGGRGGQLLVSRVGMAHGTWHTAGDRTAATERCRRWHEQQPGSKRPRSLGKRRSRGCVLAPAPCPQRNKGTGGGPMRRRRRWPPRERLPPLPRQVWRVCGQAAAGRPALLRQARCGCAAAQRRQEQRRHRPAALARRRDRWGAGLYLGPGSLLAAEGRFWRRGGRGKGQGLGGGARGWAGAGADAGTGASRAPPVAGGLLRAGGQQQGDPSAAWQRGVLCLGVRGRGGGRHAQPGRTLCWRLAAAPEEVVACACRGVAAPTDSPSSPESASGLHLCVVCAKGFMGGPKPAREARLEGSEARRRSDGSLKMRRGDG
jgi:hypothetical protein